MPPSPAGFPNAPRPLSRLTSRPTPAWPSGVEAASGPSPTWAAPFAWKASSPAMGLLAGALWLRASAELPPPPGAPGSAGNSSVSILNSALCCMVDAAWCRARKWAPEG